MKKYLYTIFLVIGITSTIMPSLEHKELEKLKKDVFVFDSIAQLGIINIDYTELTQMMEILPTNTLSEELLQLQECKFALEDLRQKTTYMLTTHLFNNYQMSMADSYDLINVCVDKLTDTSNIK